MQNEVKLFDITDAAIAELKERYIGLTINGLEDSEGYKAVKAARIDMKGYRVAVDKRRKELNEDALKYQRLINGEAKRITERLCEIEDYLANEEKKIDEMVAKIANEEKKIDEMVAKIAKELEQQLAIIKQSRIDQMLNVGFKYNGNMFISNKDIFLLVDLVRMNNEEFEVFINLQTKIHVAVEAKRLEEEAERKRLQEEAEAELAIERAKIATEREANELTAKALLAQELRVREESERLEAEKQKEIDRLAAIEKAKNVPVMPVIENKPVLEIDKAKPDADKTVFPMIISDEEFVVRVAHIICKPVLNDMEQLTLIKLSYSEMAFPERVADTEPMYTILRKKLYG